MPRFQVAFGGTTQAAFEQEDMTGSVSMSGELTTFWSAPPFVTSVHSGGRYLLDQKGIPIFMVADSAWGLAVNVGLSDMESYFSTRQSQGFNTILVELVADTYSSISPNNAQTYDGVPAFTGTVTGGYPDLTTPNPTYWDRMDSMVSYAAAYGHTLMLVPADFASAPSYMLLAARENGHSNCLTFGQFIGNRYKGSPNVVIMHGNDYEGGASDDNYVGAVATGIANVAPSMLNTLEYTPGNVAPGDYSLQAPGSFWQSGVLQLNQCYPNSSSVSNVYTCGAAAYADSTMPSFLGEWVYDGAGQATNAQIRQSYYITMLQGNLGGYFYGNQPLFEFGSGWQSLLSTTLVTQLGYWASMFRGLDWWLLAPDTANAFLTAGFSSGSTLALGAVASNGTVGVCYAPAGGTLTINMTKMAGTTTARWYDPTAGTFSSIGSFANTGSQNFTAPGSNGGGDHDFALVLTA